MNPQQGQHKMLLDGFTKVYKAMVDQLRKKYPDQIAAHDAAKRDPKGFATDLHNILNGSKMMSYLTQKSGTMDNIKAIESRDNILSQKDNYLELFKKSIGITEPDEKTK